MRTESPNWPAHKEEAFESAALFSLELSRFSAMLAEYWVAGLCADSRRTVTSNDNTGTFTNFSGSKVTLALDRNFHWEGENTDLSPVQHDVYSWPTEVSSANSLRGVCNLQRVAVRCIVLQRVSNNKGVCSSLKLMPHFPMWRYYWTAHGCVAG